MQFLGLKPCPPPPPAAAAAAAVPATATTTTTTTSYYSSCCCHWLLRCAPRNPPMTRQFLAKDSRKFRESIGECEGLFCGPLPKPSSDRPSKTWAQQPLIALPAHPPPVLLIHPVVVIESSRHLPCNTSTSSAAPKWCLMEVLRLLCRTTKPRRFLEDIPPAKVKHGVREKFAKVIHFSRRTAFQQERILTNHYIYYKERKKARKEKEERSTKGKIRTLQKGKKKVSPPKM